jgi:hypothetical protein
MYRKDAGRTAASADTIKLPLNQAWSWTSQRVQGFAPLSTSVVRGEHIYFTSGPRVGEKSQIQNRNLVCVDAETGKQVWARLLDAPRLSGWAPEDIGPAISESGIVFVTDPTVVMSPCPRRSYLLKAFSASGDLIDTCKVPTKNELDRFFIRKGDGPDDYLLAAHSKPDG